jgi:hypothetical protein
MLRPSLFPASNINDFIPNGKLVWWSWFIIGAIGLNVSNYVLAAVEAGMLKSPAIGRLRASQVLMHTDKSWSSLSGWKQMASGVWSWMGNLVWDKVREWNMVKAWINLRAKQSSNPAEKSLPSRIWVILFVLSVLSWAFVLSGLTMQTKDYYKAGHDIGAPVVGANASNFNGRLVSNLVDAAYQEWKQGVKAQIPLLGAVYTPPGDNSGINVLGGNTLSDLTEYFLAPQSSPGDAYTAYTSESVPVTGSAWGIVFKYRCYQVFDFSDFTILSQRINTSNPNYLPPPRSADGLDYFHYYYNVSDSASISILTQIGGQASTAESNIEGVAEIGFSAGFASLLDSYSYGYTPESYNGLDDEVVLEFALWQAEIPGPWEGVGPAWPAIPELEGQYKDQTNQNMSGIATRCTSSSVAGVARINGFDGTFTDFQREDPDISSNISDIPRFSLSQAAILFPSNLVATDNAPNLLYNASAFTQLSAPNATSGVNYTLVSTGDRFILPLFQAAGTIFSLPSLSGYTYQRFLWNIDLGDAIMAAYDHAAVQLMYNEQSVDWPWSHLSLAASIPWTIVVPSSPGVPPLLVLVLLVAWALGCMVLGLRFAFTKRSESSFGVISWYWYCKEIAGVDPENVLRSTS